MSFIMPIELYEKLSEKLGEETALEVVKVFEESQKRVEELVVEETKKRKLELRDELRKELATKEDILLAKQELKGQIEVVEQKIENLKQEIKGEVKTVRQELETLRQEIKGEVKNVRHGLETLRQELKGEIEVFRQEIKGEIRSLKLTIYFVGALVVIMNKEFLEFLSRIIFGVLR
jgi:DNA repair exonuclease SbcCD ATPase subunit